MIKFLIISVIITTLLSSCGFDKSKTANKEMTDSLPNSTPEVPVKSERTQWPPNYPFKLSIDERSNWDLKIDSVTAKEFDPEKKEVHIEKKVNGDSLLKAFSERFKDEIILNDSCCILKGRDKDLKVCRRQPPDDHQWTGYKGVDYDHGFLILEEWGYESWCFICFNPITRQYIYTPDEPRFIDNNLMYSAGNYYGEGQFQISNLKEDKYFGFASFNWELTGFYKRKNSILMEFTSFNNKKYLRVTFN